MIRIASVLIALLLSIPQVVRSQDLPDPAVENNSAAEAADSQPASGTLTASELVSRADSAYSADNFPLAESLYSQAIDRFGSSSVIYYNLCLLYTSDAADEL